VSSASASGIGDIWFAAVSRYHLRVIIDRGSATQPMCDPPSDVYDTAKHLRAENLIGYPVRLSTTVIAPRVRERGDTEPSISPAVSDRRRSRQAPKPSFGLPNT
jgi:hypothetical protein